MIGSAWILDDLLIPAVGLLVLAGDLVASAHAILNKRDSRAAAGWVGVIWGVPVLGALLYLTLGINRIRRRALALRCRAPRSSEPSPSVDGNPVPELASLGRVLDAVVGNSLRPGHRIELLENGDAAYPEMLAAIDGARRSIALCSYIFNVDTVGERFAAALARAVERGVAVRVLLDAVGVRYSRRSMLKRLRELGVPAASFLPPRVPWRLPYANLRNHRKLLLVDGERAFTGGLNIQAACVVGNAGRDAVQDLHFEVRGPILNDLFAVFAEDWNFTTEETLAGPVWEPARAPLPRGVLARCIPDGPDEDFERMRWTLLAALAAAQQSITLVTPYFLPDGGLIAALGLAAMRGVTVHIHLPERGNLRFVQWASTALLWQVLERGCRVFLTPGPFDHSKLMLVDGRWVLFGSSNWDPRSLRLNFELDVECHDPELARAAAAVVARRAEGGRELSLAEVDARSLPVRLRDGAARLLQPYL